MFVGMEQRVYVRPAEGLQIPHPVTGADIPESGAYVLLDRYVARRIAASELIIAAEPAEGSE